MQYTTLSNGYFDGSAFSPSSISPARCTIAPLTAYCISRTLALMLSTVIVDIVRGSRKKVNSRLGWRHCWGARKGATDPG